MGVTFQGIAADCALVSALLQIATDLGVAGLGLFVTWYVVTFWSLVRLYKVGDNQFRVLVVAVAGGLLAHIIFGMGDAVAIWDRLAFLWWWMFALSSAAFWLARNLLNLSAPEQV